MLTKSIFYLILFLNPISIILGLFSYATVAIITVFYAILVTILDYYHQFLSKIIQIDQIPLEIELKTKESFNLDQSKALKALIYPIILVYITTRLATFTTLSFTHYTLKNLINQRKHFIKIFNQVFKYVASQIWSLRFLVQMFINYILIPIWDLFTPLMELVIEFSLKFWFKTYQFYIKYSPVIISNFKKFAKSSYAVYLRYSTFLIRWGFKFYQEWVIPFMIRTLEYFKLVYPKIKDFVIQMLKFIHQLDLQYRPILMPIVLQVMEYIETTWSLVYSIVSSPVRLGLFVTRIIKEFVDPLLTLISGLVFDWYIRTSDFCTKCFTAGYEKVMVFVRIGKSWLVYGLVCGKEYSEYLNKIVVGYIVEYQILEKLGHLQHIVYQSLIAATIYIKVQAEIVMMAARKFVNRTKTEIEIISDAFNRVFRKPAK